MPDLCINDTVCESVGDQEAQSSQSAELNGIVVQRNGLASLLAKLDAQSCSEDTSVKSVNYAVDDFK